MEYAEMHVSVPNGRTVPNTPSHHAWLKSASAKTAKIPPDATSNGAKVNLAASRVKNQHAVRRARVQNTGQNVGRGLFRGLLHARKCVTIARERGLSWKQGDGGHGVTRGIHEQKCGFEESPGSYNPGARPLQREILVKSYG